MFDIKAKFVNGKHGKLKQGLTADEAVKQKYVDLVNGLQTHK